MASDPKHQHWVPQFYLGNFATPQSRCGKTPQVWLVEKAANADPKLTSVRNVCGKRYLYTPKDIAGIRDRTVDEFLFEVENLLGGLWPDICSGALSIEMIEVRTALALFASAMHLRNVDIFNKIDKALELRIKLYGHTNDGRTTKSQEDREFDPDESGPIFANIIQRKVHDIQRQLLDKGWSVLRTSRELYFTTDRPMLFLDANGGMSGPSNPNAAVLFPLSPTCALFLNAGDSTQEFLESTIGEAAACDFNRLLWSNCLRFIITGRDPLEVQREIRERK